MGNMGSITINQFKRSGFTIVELLIVIVVIGILAAITIVAFNGVQERANTTAVKSDLSAIKKKMEIFKIDNPAGTYPAIADLSSIDIKASKGSYLATTARNNFYYCLGPSGDTYALGAITKEDNGFMLTNTSLTSANGLYGATTCVAAGWPLNSGSAASGWNSAGSWSSWVR